MDKPLETAKKQIYEIVPDTDGKGGYSVVLMPNEETVAHLKNRELLELAGEGGAVVRIRKPDDFNPQQSYDPSFMPVVKNLSASPNILVGGSFYAYEGPSIIVVLPRSLVDVVSNPAVKGRGFKSYTLTEIEELIKLNVPQGKNDLLPYSHIPKNVQVLELTDPVTKLPRSILYPIGKRASVIVINDRKPVTEIAKMLWLLRDRMISNMKFYLPSMAVSLLKRIIKEHG